MLSAVLSNVPLGTADALAYSMIVIVAIFLLAGPAITYYYWKKNKRMKTAVPASPV